MKGYLSESAAATTILQKDLTFSPWIRRKAAISS